MPDPLANMEMGVLMSPVLPSGPAAWARALSECQPSGGGDGEPRVTTGLSISTLLWPACQLAQRPPQPPRTGWQSWSAQKRQPSPQEGTKPSPRKGQGDRRVGTETRPASPKTRPWGREGHGKNARGHVQTWLPHAGWKLISLYPDLEYGSLYLPCVSASEIIRLTPWWLGSKTKCILD